MRETIPKEVIEKVQEICKHAIYDGNEYHVETGPYAPCSITSAWFPEVIDLALEHLKLKASHSLVEYTQKEDPKSKNRDYDVKKRELRILNHTLPFYQLKS